MTSKSTQASPRRCEVVPTGYPDDWTCWAVRDLTDPCEENYWGKVIDGFDTAQEAGEWAAENGYLEFTPEELQEAESLGRAAGIAAADTVKLARLIRSHRGGLLH